MDNALINELSSTQSRREGKVVIKTNELARTRKKIVDTHPPLCDPTLSRYDLENMSFDPSKCIVICRVKDSYGGLLNMHGGFPMTVNGTVFRTVEALYQVVRYPNLPDVQHHIIEIPSPLMAKRYSLQFRDRGRPNWYQVKVKVMRWCLRVKLACNYDEFGKLLDSTADNTIVETSPDGNFWGGVPNEGKLVGANVFGQLLMELRGEYRTKSREEMMVVAPLAIPDFVLFGKPISEVHGK